MKAGGEIGGRQLQAEACGEIQMLPDAERVKKRFFPGNFRESMTLLTPGVWISSLRTDINMVLLF